MIKRKEFSKKLSQQNCCVIRATDWRGWGKSRELQSRKPVFWPRFQARTSKESITAALTWQVTVIHYCECQMRMYRMWNICLTESPTSVKLRLQNERSPYVCVCVCVSRGARNVSEFSEIGVKFEVFTAMNIPTVALWLMTPYSLVEFF